MRSLFLPDSTQNCVESSHSVYKKSIDEHDIINVFEMVTKEHYGIKTVKKVARSLEKGGHIAKTYGNNLIPWIQVEMNRDLYLSGEWFDQNTLKINEEKLKG